MKIINGEATRLLEDFEQAAFLFGQIQQEHARYLQQNQLQDVQKWSDERSRAMGRLQQALTAVWGCDSLRSDNRLGESLQRKIGLLVERERKLAAGVKCCQQHLKGDMAKIRKGKKAIGGYGVRVQGRNSGLCFKNSL